MYLDSKGLPTQKNGDAGDQLQRIGFWAEACYHVRPPATPILNYPTALFILNTSKGFTRSWCAPWDDPKDTSRDQLVSNTRACGYNYLGSILFTALKQIFWGVVKNFSRYPNGDIAFFQDYARFVRAFSMWPLYPICLIGDLFLLFNSLLICFWKARSPGPILKWLGKYHWFFVADSPPNAEGVPQDVHGVQNVGSDINHLGDLLQAQEIYPTPISWLARKIYVRYRPCGPLWALARYFRAEGGNNPEFIDLWSPIVMRF